jgi:dihydroorotate dehydrogenase
MSNLRRAFLFANHVLYAFIIRPIIFRVSAQSAHDALLRLLSLLDRFSLAGRALSLIHRLAFENHPRQAGGVTLAQPLILAAGFVKGQGFSTEAEALTAVRQNKNVIPGWRTMPRLVGLVEFGSFTRYPRPGNPGIVIWRDTDTRSTQNRVGLRNPGALAAAAFLARNHRHLPEQFGINIAMTPGINDPEEQQDHLRQAFDAFLSHDIQPTWFTLNLSCPNTEDDPTGSQTADQARRYCSTVLESIQANGHQLPLWVKVSPDLAPDQYMTLMHVFQELGVRAVLATNTLPRPVSGTPTLDAGVGGGRLHEHTLKAVAFLAQAGASLQADVDIIACGGIIDGRSYRAFTDQGVQIAQYWSALIFRGPLAAAIIDHEARNTS